MVDESVTTGRGFYPLTAGAPPHDWLQNMGGSIGYGMPVAVGAAVACPDRKVLALIGDGSGMYTVQALWTMAREGLDVTAVIWANRTYQILKGEFNNVGAGKPGQIVSLESPTDVGEHTANLTRIFIASSPSYILNQVYFISYVLMFILTWVATVLLLRHYTQKLGRIKYWILVSLPLIYFVIQFPPLILQLFSPLLLTTPTLFSILVTLTFALSKPVGGILFGIAFFTLARNLPRNTTIRDYMIVSTFGLILLFISNQALIWVYVPYPPFGMATVPFMGISSYLLFVGIYSSAISVAQDTTIRQTIRRYAIKESQLLDSIGTSEMEQEATNKMLKITKATQHKMTYETGVESPVNEQDMKDYLSEVLEEIKKAKERQTSR